MENLENKKIIKEMTQFVVIGLGRFGKSVATTLASLGKEVLAIDKNVENVREMEGKVTSAVLADSTVNNVLHSLGVQNFECAIVCIGDNLQDSILTTLTCKDLGVNYVVAKAQNEQHKKVLERIGADMVVFPENYMGKKVANMLANPSMNEIMNLTEDFRIMEITTPDNWENKSIGETNIRKKYNISIVFIKRGEEVIYPDSETILMENDILVVAGNINKIKELSNRSSQVIDVNHSLHDALKAD